jgi:hypothetical protein
MSIVLTLMAGRNVGLIGWRLLAVSAAAPAMPAMTAAGEAKKRNDANQYRSPNPVLGKPFHDPVLSLIMRHSAAASGL